MMWNPGPPLPWWKRLLLRWKTWRGWRRLMRKGMTVPTVKQPFPELKADDIVSVQPMTKTQQFLEMAFSEEEDFFDMENLEEDSLH